MRVRVEAVRRRWPAVADVIEARAVGGVVTLGEAEWKVLRQWHDDAQPEPWPVWARLIARRRANGEKGVGDTVERIIGPAVSDAFKVWHYAIFKRDCKCEQRKAQWNARFPYHESVL